MPGNTYGDGSLTCNDIFLFLALGYSIAVLGVQWSKYSSCRYPLQLFLVVNYSSILLFRLLSLCAYFLRNRPPIFAKMLSLFKIGVLYTFFIGWTILGNIWFIKDSKCLPEPNQFATFVIWFVLCYTWIIGYFLFMLLGWRLGVFSSLFLNPGNFDPTDIESNAILGNYLEHPGLSDSEIERIPTIVYGTGHGIDSLAQGATCAICLDSFQLYSDIKQLPGCGHIFHKEHIDEWLKRKSTCPLCRDSVDLDGLDDISQNVDEETGLLVRDS